MAKEMESNWDLKTFLGKMLILRNVEKFLEKSSLVIIWRAFLSGIKSKNNKF